MDEQEKNVNLEDQEQEGQEEKDIKWDNTEDVKGAGEKSGKVFTQKDIERFSTREKDQGKRAAYRALGIDPKDEKAIQAVKDFLASQKSEEEIKAESLLAQQQAIAAANERALIAEIKSEVMLKEIQPQYVEEAVTLLMAKVAKESEPDKADFATMIGELKIKFPSWFGKSEDDNNKDSKQGKGKDAGKKGTGSSVKAGVEKAKGEDQSIGARLAAQRKGSLPKSSYWGKK